MAIQLGEFEVNPVKNTRISSHPRHTPLARHVIPSHPRHALTLKSSNKRRRGPPLKGSQKTCLFSCLFWDLEFSKKTWNLGSKSSWNFPKSGPQTVFKTVFKTGPFFRGGGPISFNCFSYSINNITMSHQPTDS